MTINYSKLKTLLKIFILLSSSFLFLISSQAAELGVKVNNIAPDFEVLNLKGEAFKLSYYRGKKPVYLIFWATWCPACRKEIPAFIKLYEDYSEQLEILAVNIDSISFWSSLSKSNSRVNKYIEEHKLPYSIALDDEEKIMKLYQVRGTPTQILIDKNGVIKRRYPFFNAKTQYILDALLKESSSSLTDR